MTLCGPAHYSCQTSLVHPPFLKLQLYWPPFSPLIQCSVLSPRPIALAGRSHVPQLKPHTANINPSFHILKPIPSSLFCICILLSLRTKLKPHSVRISYSLL